MKILSITFHAVENILPIWEKFVNEELESLFGDLLNINKFILSEIETLMLSEGKNYNLLLFFENELNREFFLHTHFDKIEKKIYSEFGDSVMIFTTKINPIKSNLI